MKFCEAKENAKLFFGQTIDALDTDEILELAEHHLANVGAAGAPVEWGLQTIVLS